MLENIMAPVMRRLSNLEGTGQDVYDVDEDVEFIPVRNGDGSDDEEEEEEDAEKIPAGAKPRRIQLVGKGKSGVQKPIFAKGKKEP